MEVFIIKIFNKTKLDIALLISLILFVISIVLVYVLKDTLSAELFAIALLFMIIILILKFIKSNLRNILLGIITSVLLALVFNFIGLITVAMADITKLNKEACLNFLGTILGSSLTVAGAFIVTEKQIKDNNKKLQEERLQQEIKKAELLANNAKIIYLDILAALHEGLKVLKDPARRPALLSINQEYSKIIASVSNEMDADDLVLIYRVYGIIEKIRYDILHCNYLTDTYSDIEYDYDLLELEVFKDKLEGILKYEVNMITQDYLLGELSLNYKKIFRKLQDLSGIYQNIV